MLAVLAEQTNCAVPAFVARHAQFVAGHSLGEYTALVAAGALDVATALRLVRRRGELMAAANQGTMAAVIGMDEAPLRELCHELATHDAPLVIANYNAPGQLVISGAIPAVDRAKELARARGATYALSIKVSAAFHSPLMQDAAAQLAADIATATLSDPCVPVISNVTAEPLTRAADIRHELVAQMTAPVSWIASVQSMSQQGVDTFVEIGPGDLLTRGMIRRILPKARVMQVGNAAGVQAFLDGVEQRR